MTPEMENVTSPANETSLEEKEVFLATLVELAIVRYVFPVVVFIGKLTVYYDYYSRRRQSPE